MAAPAPEPQTGTRSSVEGEGSCGECVERLLQRHATAPHSTYRLQFHAGFRFEDARKLVPYLAALGVSHLYCSPIFAARAGSVHGYDVTDPNSINPGLGGEEDFRRLLAEVRQRQMGVILDVVPNHMGVGQGTNPWWQDLLENGQASDYAPFFDIDWDPVKPELRDKVLLPILGDYYGVELEQGRIRVAFEDGLFVIRYFDKSLRVDAQTVPMIFEPVRERLEEMAARWPEAAELRETLEALAQLPPHDTENALAVEQRRSRLPALRGRLGELIGGSPELQALAEKAIAQLNGEPGNASSFNALNRLLERQAYRLAHWLVSGEEINYRRFFDINDLVGLRVEEPQVFAATHLLLRRLLAEQGIAGVRVDHPDGLLLPRLHFLRLQTLYAAGHCAGPETSEPAERDGIEREVHERFQHSDGTPPTPLYLLAEKILEPGEELPGDWAVAGTTGYDFANLVNGIFIERRSETALTSLYHRIVGGAPDVGTLLYESKQLILRTVLSSEITVLGHMLDDISTDDRHARDYTLMSLTDVIRETIACFPVYRTYIDERGAVTERDRAYIGEAIARAKRRNRSMPAVMFDFLRDILLQQGEADEGARAKRLYFTLKFQQLTGPVMAKGLEDTLCYLYNRFVSLNEVGGSPAVFGVSLEEFHRGNAKRAAGWPGSMLATSTHDTKRSEDVRARLNVLSEMPRQWGSLVLRWRRQNRMRKRILSDGRAVPDSNEEYLLYQTLAGIWPWEGAPAEEHREVVGRMQEYMTKAVHEAKFNLSWINPNAEYVEALKQFIARILRPGSARRPNVFLEEMAKLASVLGLFGAVNSLSQTLLKLAAPGVPDLYQGTELWDFSLVDPDNRRWVDFERRERLLAELQEQPAGGALTTLCQKLLDNYRDGRVKLWVTMRVLEHRHRHAELFGMGEYLAVESSGAAQEHVCAFARRRNGQAVLVAAPRLGYTLMQGRKEFPLGEVWGETELKTPSAGPQSWQNLLTGERLLSGESGVLLCREVFRSFPVALLAAE